MEKVYDIVGLYLNPPESAVVLGVDEKSQVQSDGVGVQVLDMKDPAHPVHVDTLSTPAMASPHESLLLNEKRGLLVAATGQRDDRSRFH